MKLVCIIRLLGGEVGIAICLLLQSQEPILKLRGREETYTSFSMADRRGATGMRPPMAQIFLNFIQFF